MAEYINRNDALLYSEIIRVYSKDYGNIDVVPVEYLADIPAADVQPVIETENIATVSDELICKNCGIHLKDYIKVVLDEDNNGYIDELHYDYEPKFCPECGAKVKNAKLKPCP